MPDTITVTGKPLDFPILMELLKLIERCKAPITFTENSGILLTVDPEEIKAHPRANQAISQHLLGIEIEIQLKVSKKVRNLLA